jgi:hypothetical protein
VFNLLISQVDATMQNKGKKKKKKKEEEEFNEGLSV